MKERTGNRTTWWAVLLMLALHVGAVQAQQTYPPRMDQDPSLNNLVHPEGYKTAPAGTLGRVTRVGDGPVDMILIAGAGFGGEVFQAFMEANRNRFTMFAVTLPGYGGTAAPPMPPEGTSYAEQTWTRGAQEGVLRLVEEEGLDRPLIVGHWVNATQVVLGLASRHPDRFRAAIILAGVPKSLQAATSGSGSPEALARMVDQNMAPNWFKTVTPETWDDNNFLPNDYAIQPLRALNLWRQAAEPTLPVHVRYLCEYWAVDSTLQLDQLQIPLLILKPELDELYSMRLQAGRNYLQGFLQTSWEGVEERSKLITTRTIQDARIFLMDDQPEATLAAMDDFFDQQGWDVPAAAAMAARDAQPAPQFWSGKLKRKGKRYVLADAALSIELPDKSWSVEGVADSAPLVARIQNSAGNVKMSIQIQAVPGMSLEALTPLIEGALAGRYADFQKLSTAPGTLGGREAVRIVGTFSEEGEPMQGGLVFTKMEGDYLLTVGFRAPRDQYQRFRDQFEEIARSIEL